MENLDNVVSMLDYILNTQRKRHIAGGFFNERSTIVCRVCHHHYDN